MKKYLVICLAFLGLLVQGQAQSMQSKSESSKLRIGAGYFGENLMHPGFILEFEYDRAYSPVFSLPLRANLGFHSNPEYHTFFLDIHKGYRKSFRSGLFLEQSVGAGLILKSYRTEMWYLDKYYNSIPHGNKPVMGFMPSVSFGAGYDLSREKDGSGLIWLRPKVYWDLGFRMLHQPYFALQLGYTHTFKTL
jgi:hypothetical protein